jgi:hypothetical protein
MKRIALMIAALATSLVATIVLIGTPAAVSATTTTTTTTTTAPSATPTAATGVGPTAATLTASVNLDGGTLDGIQAGLNTGAKDTTGCYFEYGTTATTLTNYVSCSPTPTSTSVAQNVSAALTGLMPGQAYYYNVVMLIDSSTLPVSLPIVGGLLGATSYSGATPETFTTPTTTTLPTVATAAASNVGGTTATLNGTVNPENYGVSSCTFSYMTSGGTATTAACTTPPSGATAQTVSAAVTGLTAGTAYTYSLAIVYGSGTGTTLTSTTAGALTTMSATVSAPTNLTATTATLNGSVNPEGQTISDCSFYYGTAVATLTKTACSVAATGITGTSPIGVTVNVTGLTQKTAYIDTVILTTSSGALVVAPLGTFTTPATALAPTATTTAASAVSATTATLHATVNAEGQGIRGCEFEWGVNPLTATSTPNDDLALDELCATTPSDSGNQAVSVTLKGLAPGTKYYYRVLFLTYGGYVVANTETFTTVAVSTAKPAVKISATAVSRKAKSAKFKFVRSGKVIATKGFECALVTVTNGRAGTPHYATCKSIKTYTKLKAESYVFYLRAGNKYGYGKAVSHKFKI